MVSRRAVLASTSAAVTAALAGCASGDGDSTTGQTDEPTTESTAEPTTDGGGPRQLTGERVSPSAVPDGATVGVTTPELHGLLLDAADADGRVDLQSGGGADRDEALALGGFEYLRFRGETYEPTASFAGFAEEAAYRYELEGVDGEDVDGDVLDYESLNDAERAVADRLLGGDYSVGHHEQKPEALAPFDAHGYLRADGETYRILQTVGDYGPHHMLRLDAADPGEGAQVVAVADDVPDAGWRGAVESVVSADRTVRLDSASDVDELTEYVESVDYVASVAAVADVSVVRQVE